MNDKNSAMDGKDIAMDGKDASMNDKNRKKHRSSNDDPRAEGFTVLLALVDAIPVLEFGAGMLLIASRFQSVWFRIGAGLATLAGCGKVLWKMVLACTGKNVRILNRQFRYLMSGGFCCMILSVVRDRKKIAWKSIAKRVFRLPTAAFFAAGTCGMAAMVVMAVKLDKNDAKNNWIEQITNACAQAMFLIGIAKF